MKAIKIIRKTTQNEEHKKYIDYFLFNNTEGSFYITQAQKYLGVSNVELWRIIESFEKDFGEFFTFNYISGRNGLRETYSIKENI
ncbi:hypothetical protein Q0M94_19280 (plasmid) [Deinococcus radiomollis]|uniref:hypothetical protein n=1 Tax=Deinococcus radiomollis TaxID=468916 RepID=UPI0038914AE1